MSEIHEMKSNYGTIEWQRKRFKQTYICKKNPSIWDFLQRNGRMLHSVTYTIIQNIMKIFQRAMKIRKYLRLSKNSLMLSPKNQE